MIDLLPAATAQAPNGEPTHAVLKATISPMACRCPVFVSPTGATELQSGMVQ
jgi:hypothetical protein